MKFARSRTARRRAVQSCLVWLLACGLAAPTTAAGAGAPAASERWFVYRMANSPVGYLSETTATTGAGQTVTTVRSQLVINRLGHKVEIGQNASMTEDATGKLVAVSSDLTMSKQTTHQLATISGQQVTLHTRTGDKDYQRTLTFSGDLVGPEAVRSQSLAQLKHAGDHLTYQMFVPEFGDVRALTRTVVGTERLEQAGGQVTCTKVEETISNYPVRRTLWLDDAGRLVKHTEAGPFGLVEVLRTDKALALRAQTGGELPAEMFDQTLIRSTVRLPSPRFLDRVVLRLSPKKPELGIPAFAEGNQMLLRREGDAQVIEIRRTHAGSAAADAARPDLRAYLAPNALVQSDDAEIVKLARSTTAGTQDSFAAAKALETWVHENMHFDLGIAIAPASEIVRNRRGTCCAYATLLTALCRARDIPARVAMGLVYTSGIWGGHFWTEVLIGNEWVALDAAIPSKGVADPARIVGKRSSLADGVGADIGALWQLFTNLSIRVLEYEQGGTTVSVPEQSGSYTLKEDVYRNAWLGVTFTKPAGTHFTDLQTVYPDDTIVGADGPGVHARLVYREERGASADWKTEAATMLHKVAKRAIAAGNWNGHADMEVITPTKAAAAVPVGTAVWLLTVEGPNAAAQLQQFKTRVEWPK